MAPILKYMALAGGLVLLSGCGAFDRFQRGGAGGAEVALASPVADTPRPAARPGSGGVRPPSGARTAEAFDTTTQAERVAALAAPAAQGRELGRTTASLGPPGEPGFWLRTGLVTQAAEGRVLHAPSGASVQVELRPSGAAPGSGSQLSLAAFRALELPLTALPDLIVFAQ
ncbi:hypothetical protein [Alkalilacustris brevis]|uniref:hypothetical protein n=1 Tax=Alkalilacustris brevis TaxID=2026338 RepID=UPI001EE43BAB|nr:hypothetical protein [Alkalilacustris brevis]